MVKIMMQKWFKIGIQGEEERFNFDGKESKFLGFYIG